LKNSCSAFLREPVILRQPLETESTEPITEQVTGLPDCPKFLPKSLPQGQQQGCQIFLDTIYQKVENSTKMTKTLSNGDKFYRMIVILSKWS
jgi:hypothetical protein